jgi:hypothetical protein
MYHLLITGVGDLYQLKCVIYIGHFTKTNYPSVSPSSTLINDLSDRNIKFWGNKPIDLGEAGYHASQKFSYIPLVSRTKRYDSKP